MPLILKDADDTVEFGRLLAEAMSVSSVRSLYLFADLGGGKTTLTRGFVSALPEVLHADLYRLSEGASMPEEMEELMEEGNALLVLEWPEFLAPQYYAEERLEVRLLHSEKYEGAAHVPSLKSLDNADNSCKSFRLAELEAHGSAAEALLGQLMPRLEQRFLPEQL